MNLHILPLHRLADSLQQPLSIAFRQLIEQAQHRLHNPRMRRDLARLAEGFDGQQVTVTSKVTVT